MTIKLDDILQYVGGSVAVSGGGAVLPAENPMFFGEVKAAVVGKLPVSDHVELQAGPTLGINFGESQTSFSLLRWKFVPQALNPGAEVVVRYAPFTVPLKDAGSALLLSAGIATNHVSLEGLTPQAGEIKTGATVEVAAGVQMGPVVFQFGAQAISNPLLPDLAISNQSTNEPIAFPEATTSAMFVRLGVAI